MNPKLLALLLACWLAAGPAAAQPRTGRAAARAAARKKPKKTTTAPNAAPATSAPLAQLFDVYWEAQAQLFPLQATAQGDHRYDDRLPNDQTLAFRQRQQQLYGQCLLSLRQFNRARLSADDQVSYDIFQYELQARLDALRLNTWMLPFTQLYGLPGTLAQLGTGTSAQPFETVADYDAWLARLNQFPAWADSAIANFRRGARAGVVLPRVLVLRMVPQLLAQVGRRGTRSPFYAPIRRLPAGLAAADKTRLAGAYRQAIRGRLGPAYRRLAAFLRTEYLPQTRATTGLDALPGGAELYRAAVRQMTTTDRPPEALYQTGLREVARIRAEMEKVKTQVGFAGDLPAFFALLNTDPKLRPYKTPADVLDAFRGIQHRLAPRLPALFGRAPRTPFEIRQTEPARAATTPAEYSRGAPDGTRPGIFYVPIPDATQFATPGMESLFLHEAVPGHHYQVALQQENTRLPKFRRFGAYPAFSEGWALYCESLGPELGLYRDPYQKFGALANEMHRALRLVVDVGLHAQGLTREQAIAYLQANEPIAAPAAAAEVERYIALPAQALAYKTGALKLRELRTRYEKRLGARFRLRAFHAELLGGGAMPLPVLERRLDAWAARQR